MNSNARYLTLFCAALAGLSLVACKGKAITPETNQEHATLEKDRLKQTHSHDHSHQHDHHHDHDHHHGKNQHHGHEDPHQHHHHRGGHHEHDHHEHDHDEIVRLTPEQMAEAGIYTAPVREGELRHLIRAPGRVVLKNDKIAHVIPPISGIVERVYKQIGDQVEEGETIAIIRSRDMADAKSQYLAARKLEVMNKALFKKEAGLYGKKISTENEYLQAQHEAVTAGIHCDTACQRLYALGLTQQEIKALPDAAPETLALYPLEAPIHGTIIERDMTQGEYVDGTQENFKIADLSDLHLEISLYPSDLVHVKKGQPVHVHDHEGNLVEGSLEYVKPLLNDETRLAHAFANLENSKGNWHPGCYLTATIEAKRTEYPIVIPKESIQLMDGFPAVFVYTDEGFEIRHIRLGQEDEEFAEVVGGLDSGETIARGNTFLLKADHEKDEAAHEH